MNKRSFYLIIFLFAFFGCKKNVEPEYFNNNLSALKRMTRMYISEPSRIDTFRFYYSNNYLNQIVRNSSLRGVYDTIAFNPLDDSIYLNSKNDNSFSTLLVFDQSKQFISSISYHMILTGMHSWCYFKYKDNLVDTVINIGTYSSHTLKSYIIKDPLLPNQLIFKATDDAIPDDDSSLTRITLRDEEDKFGLNIVPQQGYFFLDTPNLIRPFSNSFPLNLTGKKLQISKKLFKKIVQPYRIYDSVNNIWYDNIIFTYDFDYAFDSYQNPTRIKIKITKEDLLNPEYNSSEEIETTYTYDYTHK